MLKLIFMFISLAGTLLLSSCFKHDVKTFVVSTPQMDGGESASMISNAVAHLRGVHKVKPDLERRELLVSYDSLMLAEKNVEAAIAQAGFDANSVLADPIVRGAVEKKLTERKIDGQHSTH